MAGSSQLTPSLITDRNTSICLPGFTKVYPAPIAFDDSPPSNNYQLYSLAPWLDRAEIDSGTILQHYVSNDGFLPGFIPAAATRTETWHRQFSCYDEDLRLGPSESVESARRLFAQRAYRGIHRILTYTPIPVTFQVDNFLYRTIGEVDYVELLEEVTDAQPAHWRQSLFNAPDGVVVSNDAMIFI